MIPCEDSLLEEVRRRQREDVAEAYDRLGDVDLVVKEVWLPKDVVLRRLDEIAHEAESETERLRQEGSEQRAPLDSLHREESDADGAERRPPEAQIGFAESEAPRGQGEGGVPAAGGA